MLCDQVFYCHTTPKFKGYVNPLEGYNGTKVNVLAICHYDTKDFNPVFFEIIHVKPSTKSIICHFLMEDHLVWKFVVKKLPQEKFVLCHQVVLSQAVFYCHSAPKFKGCVIPLEENNGIKVNALANCHSKLFIAIAARGTVECNEAFSCTCHPNMKPHVHV